MTQREILLDLWVPGRPVPQPRPRTYRTRTGQTITVSNDPKVRAWKTLIQLAIRQKPRQPSPYRQAFELEIHAYLRSTRRCPDGTPHTSRPDCDNIAKPIADALREAGIIPDDNAISDIIIRKRIANTQGVQIRLSTLPETPETYRTRCQIAEPTAPAVRPAA